MRTVIFFRSLNLNLSGTTGYISSVDVSVDIFFFLNATGPSSFEFAFSEQELIRGFCRYLNICMNRLDKRIRFFSK